jgi:hypothetical protein
MDRIRQVEIEAIRTSHQNVDLATDILKLAEEADTGKIVEPSDPRAQGELQRLEKDLKASRQRWKVMKGTASAVVVGSGVDWVRDDHLKDMVLNSD